jgi:UDP-2,3-diacylglucosamine hydrolase
MELAPGKKIYFLSDFHLGAPNETESRKREERLVRFLNHAQKDAAAFFIVGDIFDFWF